MEVFAANGKVIGIIEEGRMFTDRLEEMFNKQKIMQKRIRNHELPKRMPERYPMEVASIIAELGELLEEDQAWKDWKKNPKPPGDNMPVEVADLWHFIINLTLYMGYDAHDVYDAFTAKNAVNHQRQDNNY